MGYCLLQQLKTQKFIISVVLARHCNLKCRYCNGFCNFAKKEFYDFEQLKQDILELKKNNIPISHFTFWGGEPLLHPNLTEILDFTYQQFPNTYLAILTNGKDLLKMDDNFYQVVKRTKTNIMYSMYGNSNIDYKKSIEYVKSKGCQITNVRYENKRNQHEDLSMTKFLVHRFAKTPLDGRKNRQGCDCDGNAMWNGKIYLCHRIALIDTFIEKTKFNLPLENSSIDVKGISKQKLFNFLLKTPKVCNYCLGFDKSIVKDWTTEKGEIRDLICEKYGDEY